MDVDFKILISQPRLTYLLQVTWVKSRTKEDVVPVGPLRAIQLSKVLFLRKSHFKRVSSCHQSIFQSSSLSIAPWMVRLVTTLTAQIIYKVVVKAAGWSTLGYSRMNGAPCLNLITLTLHKIRVLMELVGMTLVKSMEELALGAQLQGPMIFQ